MKTLKTLALATLISLIGTTSYASTMNAVCKVEDKRFISTTGMDVIRIENVLGQKATGNFPKTEKHDETMITDDYVTMAFSDGQKNFYVFSLERPDVEAAISSHSGQAYAEVRFTNDNSAQYESYLRDGQMLKLYADCQLELVP